MATSLLDLAKGAWGSLTHDTAKVLQQMAQGVAGYQDVQRLASDVEEVVRDLRSLSPKIDSLGMTQPTKHNVRLSDSMLFSSIPLHVLKGTQNN